MPALWAIIPTASPSSRAASCASNCAQCGPTAPTTAYRNQPFPGSRKHANRTASSRSSLPSCDLPTNCAHELNALCPSPPPLFGGTPGGRSPPGDLCPLPGACFCPQKLPFSASRDSFSPARDSFPQAGELLSRSGDLSSRSGELFPQPGELSSRSEELSPQPGELLSRSEELSPQPRELSSRSEQLSPHPENLSSRSGELSPQPGELSSQTEKLSPQAEKLSLEPEEVSPQAAKRAFSLRSGHRHRWRSCPGFFSDSPRLSTGPGIIVYTLVRTVGKKAVMGPWSDIANIRTL